MYLSSVLVQRLLLPYRHLTHGHLSCKSREVEVLDWGRVNTQRRRILGSIAMRWTGSSSGKAIGYELDGPGSIPGVEAVEIFLHSCLSSIVLGYIQPLIE